MIYLLLAISCSTVISVILRVTESRRSSTAGFFLANYAICIVLSSLYLPKASVTFSPSGTGLALSLGAVSGVLYLVSFVAHLRNIERNGVVLSSIFMRLGIVMTVLLSIVVFGDRPGGKEILGILLSFAAIIILNFDRKGLPAGGSMPQLLLLFLISGVNECMLNIYDNVGNPELGSTYLLTTFFVAFLSTFVLQVIRKEKITTADLCFGLLLGIPNYYSSRFMMLALKEVPNVIAYPVYSVSTIVATGIIGVLVFKEKMTALKAVGFAAVLGALALLS